MKLIDLLVQELPKRGGWPDGAECAVQDADYQLCFSSHSEVSINNKKTYWLDGQWSGGWSNPHLDDVADDRDSSIVTRDQYESALAASKEPLTGIVVDDWIEWGGGECPVNASEMVDVIFGRGGIMSTNIADCWRWNHSGTDSDIIAYRLHQPQEVEQAEADDEADLNECIGQDAAQVWNGECLPPVGAKVEFFINPKLGYRNPWIPDAGTEMEVVAHKTTTDGNDVAVCYWDEGGAGRSYCLIPESLKPLRTEAEKKRDAFINAVLDDMRVIPCDLSLRDEVAVIYDAIAAGKIPGVKLDD